MKTKIIFTIIMSLIFCTLITSCKKADTKKTPSEYLCSSSWKVVSVKDDFTNNNTDDGILQAPNACQADDLMTYTSNNNYSTNVGANNTCLDVNTTGTWSLNSANTILSKSQNGGLSWTENILQLDANTLKIEIVNSITPYHSAVATFNH